MSLFTPEDLRRAEESGELDSGSNIFHLRPDPIQFVDYLKSIDRVDISSDIFVRLLGAYQESKGNSESDPMRYEAVLLTKTVTETCRKDSAIPTDRDADTNTIVC